MGRAWSSISFLSSSPSTPQTDGKDVLALCEDGDLLLAREKLADSALRVGVEFVVARDIQRMQRGQFPTKRVTSLPPWTSCELLLRHEGALHVASIGANGLQFVPFEERVVSKIPHIHDRFAIRRLRHDARSENLSITLRELAIQIAAIAPISWQTLLFPTTRTQISPRSPRQQSVDRDAVIDALKELPPIIRRLLRRMLELFCQGLTLDDTSHPHNPDKTEDPNVGTELRVALDALGGAEVTARLSAAFVATVYEFVHLLDPINVSTNNPLVPAAFWSNCSDNERLNFTPSTALGSEMSLVIPTRD
ncbi:hypothetical protein, variant [Phytophthora nicotianae P10297]|uniref:Uncharacterized protein n=3 Tax=Phytophthora nicotianae TaxID=4792 RepID=W2PY58_PHYN3|nr:hypothetical protein, variant [Phytophthora nicotianae INRA-310]ETK82347.1 hypothetical protein, variant [Phytophthora nicotianae]ETN05802.1 hypothetical protein, variant [Phytophthora nicotianae INRA-310]ETP40181.1 hypothetical protein, variant [Phytophthora nicotianae P10297]